MIDQRLVDAVASLVQESCSHHRAYLIGGQALRDLHAELQVRFGPDIPDVRTSDDIDLLLALDDAPDAHQALHAAITEHWEPIPNRPASFRWLADRTVELDLVTTYERDQAPAEPMRIAISGSSRVRAYRILPAWLHAMNLIEPCNALALRRINLQRLRHGALLVSKLLAVHASVSKLAESASPPTWTERVNRDLDDVHFLTGLSIRRSLWCPAVSSKRAELHRQMDPLLYQLRGWAADPPERLTPATRERLRHLMDGVPSWWR